MPANRILKRFIIIAAIAAAALGVFVWLISKQTSELMNAASAAQTAKAALVQEQVRSQQAAVKLTQSSQQAQEQASALQKSIEDSQRHQQAQMQLANRIRELRNGLAAASSLKVGMAEHFMVTGKWPISNQEFGASAPDSYKTNTLRSIAAEANGKIKLVFDNEGTKEHLWLHASANPAGAISWRCVSPDIVDVAQVAAGCTYGSSP